jgi:hypothetical protein
MNAPLPDSVRKALESVTLDDKYSLEHGRAFMSGTQALVRLPMLQKKRDAMFGLKTGCFISGYRGSPLGGYDQALRAKSHLATQDIVFSPASTRSSAPPRSGARSSSTSIPNRSASTACSASGTARARAWTAAPTSSSTPTSPAPPGTAA